ncbi:MAG: protoheme IX farnesyltransferase [Deltaproteobacteria bacterium]|nr:MAG: protoheme IX farnesyltransferase [Deltaproteobacteria bacterium]
MSQVQEPIAVTAPQRSFAEWAKIYLDVTRPRVIALVLFTGLPMLFLGRSGWPDLWTAAWILAGTALAGGASSALNAYVERESDALMARTRKRPLPTAMIVPNTMLAYGLVLSVVSTALLWLVGGPLAAAVGLSTIAFYVLVYTVWLKPRTPQNIVIGGAAGATAPLIVSAGLDGTLSVQSWILFAIIFLWTPPHFWAVAIYRRDEYARAGLPMMPLVVGDQPTRWRSLVYTVLTLAVSLLPFAMGDLGLVYLAAAVGLGAWFLVAVVRSMVAPRPQADRRVFIVSIAYLFFLYLAMMVDAVLPW